MPGVRQADIDVHQAQFAGLAAGAPMEADEWLAVGVREHLDVAPGDPVGAGAKGLHHRLFRGEADGEGGDAVATYVEFRLGVYSSEKPLAPPGYRVSDSLDLDYVHTDGVHLNVLKREHLGCALLYVVNGGFTTQVEAWERVGEMVRGGAVALGGGLRYNEDRSQDAAA